MAEEKSAVTVAPHPVSGTDGEIEQDRGLPSEPIVHVTEGALSGLAVVVVRVMVPGATVSRVKPWLTVRLLPAASVSTTVTV